MAKESTKKFRLLYSILVSISLAIAGLCLIFACVGIYLSGEDAFTRQSVAAAFQYIAIPVYISIALVIGSFVIDSFTPPEKKRPKGEKQDTLILQRLHNKVDLRLCDEALRQQVLKQQLLRRIHKYITAGLLAVGSIIFLSYALNGQNFSDSAYNESVIRAMWVMLPCLAVPCGYSIFTVYFCKASIRKEIALMKQTEPCGCHPPEETAYAETTKENIVSALRIAAIAVAVVLVVMGLMNDGTRDVLAKAIKICTECVGLG